MKLEKSKGTRKIARYSLMIMGAGFLATAPFQEVTWVELLHGGFEAGVVGGLADWFAVTALFRHPLGIKIPHTALLPNNRERMTNAIVKIIKNDWLSKESIQEKVKAIHFSEKMIISIEKEIESDYAKKAVIKLIKEMLHYIDADRITPYVKNQLLSAVSKVDMRKILVTISDTLLNEECDKKALNHILDKAEAWLKLDETALKLGTVSMNVLNKIEVDGFLQFAIKSLQSILNEEKLGGIIQNLLLSILRSLKQEGDPNREALLAYIQNEISGIGSNEKLLQSVEHWKSLLLANWEPEQMITASLNQLKENAIELVETDGFYENNIIPLIYHLLEKLKGQQDAIDQWFQQQIAILIENNHDKIGDLVQENLDKLDNETLIDMVENNIGKDLQWIRVNGAVCGFAIGMVLTTIQMVTRLM
ncbi:DUF445 domain-containing protein [Bacillus benzoevorans]|uniref:Uncharacterized membrane-anchored protein YjiN (DUF445 family) n=1 Tax=Bacillus benzoevorans TaxID=1456 RepID=A0A7X0HW37_9BACI|nr:DUF445 domain-containing protein [Bacillus benzoevorans]MBB6446661.1 uncharacterized membrane-anchored protein YjiN (DUF445 family) [Bacillus benzoevorans]